jgi:hypothetical protein
MDHVHDASCDLTAVTTYRLNGKEHVWNIAAICKDTEATIRVHLKNIIPQAEFVSVAFESARKMKS